jgi:hypothetical protein
VFVSPRTYSSIKEPSGCFSLNDIGDAGIAMAAVEKRQREVIANTQTALDSLEKNIIIFELLGLLLSSS